MAITIGGSFFFYGGIRVVVWMFFFNCLPETKGKTLEEMEEFFGVKREDEKVEKEGVNCIGGGKSIWERSLLEERTFKKTRGVN